jgi:hypothetical protein
MHSYFFVIVQLSCCVCVASADSSDQWASHQQTKESTTAETFVVGEIHERLSWR